MLVGKRHEQPAHPLAAQGKKQTKKLFSSPAGRKVRRDPVHPRDRTAYVLFRLMLCTAVCGFRVPE